MRIALVTPAPRASRAGNRATARRWARFLREDGHQVTVSTEWRGEPADLLIALHARRSHGSIRAWRQGHPRAPLVVVLTGTDLYRDIRADAAARESLVLADLLAVLQDQGGQELAPELRSKVRVVYQSAPAVAKAPHLRRAFEVVVAGHLREEKDPFRAAAAACLLPATSRVLVNQLGKALSPEMAREAGDWMERTRRYRWRGEKSPGEARQAIARARLLVISSVMEGGANVIAEAVMSDTPVLASRVPGNVGMLGADYPGYFPLGDAAELARLLARAEAEPAFLARLAAACAARRHLFEPGGETAAVQALAREALSLPRGPRAGKSRPG